MIFFFIYICDYKYIFLIFFFNKMIKVDKKLCEYPVIFKKIPFKKFIEIIPEQKGNYDYIIDIIQLSTNNIAIASYTSYISILEPNNFNSIQNIECNRNGIYKLLEINLNNNKILIATSNKKIELFNIENYEKIKEINDNLNGSVISIEYDRINKLLFAGCNDSILNIYKLNDINSIELIKTINEIHGSIKSLCLISPFNKFLFTGCDNGNINKFNLENNYQKIGFIHFRYSHLTQMSQISNEKLAINSWGGSIYIIKVNEFILDCEIVIHMNCPVNNFIFFNNNNNILVSCEFGIFGFYDMERKRFITKYFIKGKKKAKKIFMLKNKDIILIQGDTKIYKC